MEAVVPSQKVLAPPPSEREKVILLEIFGIYNPEDCI